MLPTSICSNALYIGSDVEVKFDTSFFFEQSKLWLCEFKNIQLILSKHIPCLRHLRNAVYLLTQLSYLDYWSPFPSKSCVHSSRSYLLSTVSVYLQFVLLFSSLFLMANGQKPLTQVGNTTVLEGGGGKRSQLRIYKKLSLTSGQWAIISSYFEAPSAQRYIKAR